MSLKPALIVLAELRRVHDVDTYSMLLDLEGGGDFEEGAETRWIRLRDFSGPELRDAATGEMLSGVDAAQAAEYMLGHASEILVELKGSYSFRRHVAWVWVDGEALGPELVKRRAVRPGRRVG
jgi:endonuclease YncB( thermonuclease family)